MFALLGRHTLNFFHQLGEFNLLIYKTFISFFKKPFPAKSLFQQMVRIGWDSLPVIIFTALATGAILALQTGYALMTRIKGTETYVGGIVALILTRELGPVLCAIMVAGRAGSGITAEIGTMKVTEQLDALTTLSANPIHYLVVPRVLAGIIMLPILTLITDIVGILGGMFVAINEIGLNQANYVNMTLQFLTMADVYNGLIKSVVFGIIITTIASYEGFKTMGGAEGVGRATTRSVVTICMAILFFDYIVTSVLTTGI